MKIKSPFGELEVNDTANLKPLIKSMAEYTDLLKLHAEIKASPGYHRPVFGQK